MKFKLIKKKIETPPKFKDLSKEIKKLEKVFEKKDVLIILILISLSFYATIDNYNMLKKDNMSSSGDAYNLYYMSARYYEMLREGRYYEFFDTLVIRYNSHDPPFILFQAFPFYLIFGLSEDIATFSNVIHIFIIIISTYFIGKKIMNSFVGFLASLILVFMPGFLPFSRVFLPEFALTSFLLLTIFFTLYSNFFREKNYSILFGISFALGMLTKTTFLIYILPVIFVFSIKYYFWQRKNKIKLISKNQLINILISIIIIFVIAFFWYQKNIVLILNVTKNLDNYYKTINSTHSYLDNIANSAYGYIYENLLKVFMRGYFLILILAVFFPFVNKKKSINTKDIIIIIILIGLILVNIPVFPRYLVPIIPFFSLLIGAFFFEFFCFISSLSKNKIKPESLVIILIICLFSFMFIYNNEIRKQEIKIPWCGPTQFYSKGMVIARQSYPSTEETLICAFNSIISKENITKILSLDATDITFYLSYMFNTSYSFSAPNLCLTGNTLNVNDYYGNCRIPKNISKKYIYEFDIIITSKEILPENYDTLLKEYFPERKKVINHILSVWEECKREFMLKEIINYPIDKNCRKNEFSNLYVYVKKS